MLPQRLRSSGRLIFRTVSLKRLGGGGGGGDGESTVSHAVGMPNIKRRISNSWSAIQDTYLSTKEVFERHRVVFAVGTSIASILTAWAGYTLRHMQQSKIEKRLGSIEEAMKNNNDTKHEEIKKMVSSGNVSTTACVVTAWTSLLIGYGLGWRSGSWFASRKFQREQLKMMGQMKPHRWQFLRRPFVPLRNSRAVPLHKPAEFSPIANGSALAQVQGHKPC